MFPIEQVSTTDQRFLEVERRFPVFLNEFVDYSHQRSLLNGKVSKTSNKAKSYQRYLIRLIIHFEKTNKEKLNDLYSFDTFNKLNGIREEKGFKKFNESTNRFYGASLSEYERFLKNNRENLDREIEHRIEEEVLEREYKNIKIDETRLSKTEQPRKKKIKYKSYYMYPRDANEALYAKEKADWKCEVDESHATFKTKSGKQFVEIHHLIPLSVQNEYDNTIDFAANMAALCPTCHRLLHHAAHSEKEPILQKLFNERKDKYPQYGIQISFDQLLSYY